MEEQDRSLERSDCNALQSRLGLLCGLKYLHTHLCEGGASARFVYWDWAWAGCMLVSGF